MNDTCQAPCRGEVESPARRQGSSTVGTLIFAGWLPHFVPPSRGCLGLRTCVRTILPCTNERRGFPIPDSCAFRPDLQPCSLNSNCLRQTFNFGLGYTGVEVSICLSASHPIAHINPNNSLATEVTATLWFFPRETILIYFR